MEWERKAAIDSPTFATARGHPTNRKVDTAKKRGDERSGVGGREHSKDEETTRMEKGKQIHINRIHEKQQGLPGSFTEFMQEDQSTLFPAV
ncbi:hypothetical protein [Acanthopleuribacter pedis]|uniref:Uncharacterized protein n=1 Tax=Acanthopleuribacter pedis TaxID=442870 RepID=A0A8J7QCT2_9BACT|nr:hypothetical protein [Acanthopleuribacter pedis]MBO1317334.1 hypothetical protein [Acanthopleuribacter pedis]MBO1318641.1 hypothetical protein [Acanthopleuribacter pedis]